MNRRLSRSFCVASLLVVLASTFATPALPQVGDSPWELEQEESTVEKPVDKAPWNLKQAESLEHFVGFVGVVTKSDYRKTETQITFANLGSPRPFITWPAGNGAETNRVYEDDELIVLFFVASATGSTETFYLYKKLKRFALIEAAVWEASATNPQLVPKVTHGTLKALSE